MKQFIRIPLHSLNENERVLRVIHRHWFNILERLLPLVVALFVVFIGYAAVITLFPSAREREFYSLFLFLESTFVLVSWIYVFLVWIDYYFDVWIITNERIVNIEQQGLFRRRMSELHLTRIQDVTTEVHGFLATMLNFGDVHVQTAAEEVKFIFRQVPDPHKLRNEIMNATHKPLQGNEQS